MQNVTTEPMQGTVGSEGRSSTARGVVKRTREELRKLGDQAKEQALDAKDNVKDQSRAYLNTKKNQIGEELYHVSGAVNRAAEELRREDDQNLAKYADMLARKTEGAAEYVWEHKVGDFVCTAENAARKHPELVFGGLVVAGLALARFLKASEPSMPAREVEVDRYSSGGQFTGASAYPTDPAGIYTGNPPSTPGAVPSAPAAPGYQSSGYSSTPASVEQREI